MRIFPSQLSMALIFGFALICVGAWQQPVVAQEITVDGWFHIVWNDRPHFDLLDDSGVSWSLRISDATFATFGGPQGLVGRRVRIVGQRLEGLQNVVVVDSIQIVEERSRLSNQAAVTATSSRPFVTLICQFPDLPPYPKPVSWFVALMGNNYPGLDHYWRESSYGLIDLAGSAVAGSYMMPQPRSFYVFDNNGDGKEDLDFQKTANDCTAAAETDVYFPDFYGINAVFNGVLGSNYGGTRTLTRDGVTRQFGFTWIELAGSLHQEVYAHEIGHSFGLPHSSGPYSETYDSKWDVMSGKSVCPPSDPNFGCIGVHTIAYHKDRLGWLPGSRVLQVNTGQVVTAIIERTANSPANSNYLMAKIVIPGAAYFFTVEARKFSGYDTRTPGQGVIIHRVDPTFTDRLARVVDIDNNGNPNDSGAIWTPGEMFVDASGIRVEVTAETATGYQVTISNYSQPPPLSNMVFSDAMENGSGNWVADPPWALTSAAAHSVSHSWTDSPSGNYGNNVNASLRSPLLDLTRRTKATLAFWHRFDFVSGDGGHMWVRPVGASWMHLRAFSGTQLNWHKEEINLDAFVGSIIEFTFQVLSDGSGSADGWYVDDVTIISPTVTCPGESLQSAVDAATPGQIITVSGTCNENILIRNEKQRITIDGAGAGVGTRAIVNGNSNSPVFNVRGKGILLQNFTITGGSNGVHVNRGANAVLSINEIQTSFGNGVVIDELAFAVLTNNVIQNHPGAGVVISEASTARIGFNADSDTVASANTVQNNTADGIVLSHGSSARIIGNNIVSNGGNGILVTRDSHADIASNAISGNGGDGIEISENSNVQLGEDSGTSIYEAASATTSANTGFGIKCSDGGVADGRIGTLTGGAGAKSFTGMDCIDSLNP